MPQIRAKNRGVFGGEAPTRNHLGWLVLSRLDNMLNILKYCLLTFCLIGSFIFIHDVAMIVLGPAVVLRQFVVS